jgi:hypothetical protein
LGVMATSNAHKYSDMYTIIMKICLNSIICFKSYY